MERWLAVAIEVTDALGCGARQRDHPSRHQAREHLYLQARPREDLDFGLAKIADDAKSGSGDSQTMARCRCPHLTSPGTVGNRGVHVAEQVRGKDLDARTDLFSLSRALRNGDRQTAIS
jgi:hypothetical protein